MRSEHPVIELGRAALLAPKATHSLWSLDQPLLAPRVLRRAGAPSRAPADCEQLQRSAEYSQRCGYQSWSASRSSRLSARRLCGGLPIVARRMRQALPKGSHSSATETSIAARVAAALARTRWPQREIIEAGHHAIEGSRSSDEAILAAHASGIDLSDHRATRLSPQILVPADAVFVFDARDLIAIATANPRSCPSCTCSERSRRTGPLQIKDPHGHGPDAYASTFTQIAAALGRAP